MASPLSLAPSRSHRLLIVMALTLNHAGGATCKFTDSTFIYAHGRSIIHFGGEFGPEFTEHGDDVILLAVQPSERAYGGHVASYDRGHRLIVWNWQTSSINYTYQSDIPFTALAWTMDGYVIAGMFQKTSTCAVLTSFQGHAAGAIMFEPKRRSLWNIEPALPFAITALAQAPHWGYFAIGYSNGDVVVAILQPKFEFVLMPGLNRAQPVTTVAWYQTFGQHKAKLAIGARDGSVIVYELQYLATHGLKLQIILASAPCEVWQQGTRAC
ncbi:hypothetical protein PWT90_02036 [Aphanocladium album]|nr:hypothetical protein PWT90_02036 [Aphanocladium album]